MGLFRKKSDPLAQRATSLNRRIAELEAEIARLNQNLEPPPAPAANPGSSPRTPSSPFRPTAPQRPDVPKSASPSTPLSHEPVFEEMRSKPIDTQPNREPGRESVELGLKRPLLSEGWRRLKRQFVDPPPANEKLVNYLAAGSIQGLRTLRYEKRIARNRILFVCVVLGILLTCVLAVVWHSR